MNINTQCARILRHMRSAGYITTFDAMTKLHIASLSRRICDLKERGHTISYRWDVSDTGARYKVYFLA